MLRTLFSYGRRLRLFARDYCDQFGVAWSIARMRDCERNGGHQWGKMTYDMTLKSNGQTCSRCGTWQPLPYTSGSGSATLTVWMPNTTTTQGWSNRRA